ncbi:hypothetical protein NDU88_002053 [Pleurodeles waltl]|uniref:Uncharacterized protein n=1 Tax=Pleurodeles waltl TaxID=8319 RepID=A0AAV7W1U1_PLEWA|nr:hypothetical protein NDU88_002053 [Pleurodeles waltl]
MPFCCSSDLVLDEVKQNISNTAATKYTTAMLSVLVLPSATPEERSERGRKDQTVAARVPPQYAFGDRGHINETNKTYRVSFNLVFPRLLHLAMRVISRRCKPARKVS